jgi:hypothetical protein
MTDTERIDAADVTWTTATLPATCALIGDVTVALGESECRVEGDGFVSFEDD